MIRLITSVMARVFQVRFSRFLLVGVFGLAVDASVFFVAHLSLGLLLSRAIAFLVAVTATWVFNRVFTFQSKDVRYKSEWLRYVLVNFFGGCLNFFGFMLLVQHVAVLHANPLIALIGMSAVVAVINYYASQQFAFAKRYA